MIRQTVDEEPFIQALKTRAVLPEITDGRTMIGQSHDYKRSGTTTLFEALPLPDRPASRGTSTSKASQPDTEFHGVGIIALRAENHSTIPVALREAPKASTPCNSVPYSAKLRVGLACLALKPVTPAASQSAKCDCPAPKPQITPFSRSPASASASIPSRSPQHRIGVLAQQRRRDAIIRRRLRQPHRIGDHLHRLAGRRAPSRAPRRAPPRADRRTPRTAC